jgi:hypothetical protein
MEGSPNPFPFGNAAALGGFLELRIQLRRNEDLESVTHMSMLTYSKHPAQAQIKL